MKLNKAEKEVVKNYINSEWAKRPNHLPSISTLIYDIIGNPTRERITLINACAFENYKLLKEGK